MSEAAPPQGEAARRQRRRKRRVWDQAPAEAGTDAALAPAPTSSAPAPAPAPAAPLTPAQQASLASIRLHLAEETADFLRLRAARQTSADRAGRVRAYVQRALLLLGRVYVGGISEEMSEAVIREAFAPFGFVHTVAVTPQDPVTKKRGYCFVEFDCPESAVMAIERVNESGIAGTPVRCSRPANVAESAMK